MFFIVDVNVSYVIIITVMRSPMDPLFSPNMSCQVDKAGSEVDLRFKYIIQLMLRHFTC